MAEPSNTWEDETVAQGVLVSFLRTQYNEDVNLFYDNNLKCAQLKYYIRGASKRILTANAMEITTLLFQYLKGMGAPLHDGTTPGEAFDAVFDAFMGGDTLVLQLANIIDEYFLFYDETEQ